MKKRTSILLLLLVAILILVGLVWCHVKKPKISNEASMLNALQDSVKIYKDKWGNTHAKISAIVEGKDRLHLLDVETKDQLINKLKREIDRNKKKLKEVGSSITVFEEILASDIKLETQILWDTLFKDTLLRDTCLEVFFAHNYPVYKAYFEPRHWRKGHIIASRDSIQLRDSIINEYILLIGSEKQRVEGKLFRQRVVFADVTNENPYATPKTLRSYLVGEEPVRRFGIGFNLGYGFVYDIEENKIKRGIVLGAGINYKLFK